MHHKPAIYFDANGVICCHGRANFDDLSTVDFARVQILKNLSVKTGAPLVVLSLDLRTWEDQKCLPFLEKIGLKDHLFMPAWKAPFFTTGGNVIRAIGENQVVNPDTISENNKPAEVAMHARENGISFYVAFDDKPFCAANRQGEFIQAPFGLNQGLADQASELLMPHPDRPVTHIFEPSTGRVRSAVTSDFQLPLIEVR